ncbi:MAG TPA: hypothetical protein VN721_00295 [Flavipsychrobacter sp.]|nr:hypothetical protein [Flavipsychrobacter sp.]
MTVRLCLLPFACILLISSCNYAGKTGNHGPIVLGDSSTIVTETDSESLKDLVTEITPPAQEEQQQPQDTVTSQQPAQDSTQIKAVKQPAEQQTKKPEAIAAATQPAGQGLSVAFKEVTVFIPNIVTKSYRNQHPERANGATYQLAGGTINGKQIKVSGGNVTKISQRYQTIIMIKNQVGTLQLDALSNTTDWKPLRGGSNTYYISGLDPSKLEYTKASTSAIRNAVQRATRAHRMSRRYAQEWMQSVRNVRATNQRPLYVVLKSVVWKIEGKNAQGRAFQKQLRIDIPTP